MTFLAARLPNGRGVGSTTGTAARAAAGAAGARVLEGLGADAGAAAAADLTGDVAATAGAALPVVFAAVFVAVFTAVFAAGWLADFGSAAFAGGGAGFLTGALAAGAADLTAAFAMVLVTGWTGLVALTAAVFTGVLLVLAAVPAFTEVVAFLAAVSTFAALGAGFVIALADDFGAGLAAGLPGADALGAADGMRAWFPDATGLPFFALLVAGAFTKGLLSVPDDAWSGGGTASRAGDR